VHTYHRDSRIRKIQEKGSSCDCPTVISATVSYFVHFFVSNYPRRPPVGEAGDEQFCKYVLPSVCTCMYVCMRREIHAVQALSCLTVVLIKIVCLID